MEKTRHERGRGLVSCKSSESMPEHETGEQEDWRELPVPTQIAQCRLRPISLTSFDQVYPRVQIDVSMSPAARQQRSSPRTIDEKDEIGDQRWNLKAKMRRRESSTILASPTSSPSPSSSHSMPATIAALELLMSGDNQAGRGICSPRKRRQQRVLSDPCVLDALTLQSNSSSLGRTRSAETSSAPLALHKYASCHGSPITRTASYHSTHSTSAAAPAATPAAQTQWRRRKIHSGCIFPSANDSSFNNRFNLWLFVAVCLMAACSCFGVLMHVPRAAYIPSL
eukprot:980982-Rhodomonas_salina.1